MAWLISGWFLNGAAPLWEFVAQVLEFLDAPDIAKQKLVKSSESHIITLRKAFNRLVLFQLSEIEDSNGAEDVTIALLDRILFWQAVLFSDANQDGDFLRMFCYHLYVFLFDTRRRVRLVASNVTPLLTVLIIDMEIITIKQRGTNYKYFGFRQVTGTSTSVGWVYGDYGDGICLVR